MKSADQCRSDAESANDVPDSSRLKGAVYFLESVGMGVCIGYLWLAWMATFGPFAHMYQGDRYFFFSPGDTVAVVVGCVSSLSAYRRKRMMARITLVFCAARIYWMMTPVIF